MNLILERLHSVLLVFVSLGLLSVEQLKFILYISNKKKGVEISEPIGYPDLSLEKSLEINDTACKCSRKIKIPMFCVHDYQIGIFSEFNNPKFEQAIRVLLSVAINCMECNPKLSLADQRLVMEADLVNRICLLENPYIHEVAEIFTNVKIGISSQKKQFN
jgi:hypothetical protein